MKNKQMNINDNLEEDFNTFNLNSESRDYLITSAKWAKIIAVTSFISVVVSLLAVVGFMSFFGTRGVSTGREFMVVLYFLIFIVFGVMAVSPFYMLYQFSRETSASLVEFKGVPLYKGIRYLKSFFKTIVLFILITIVLYIAVILSFASYF